MTYRDLTRGLSRTQLDIFRDIDLFNQWRVERGKVLAERIIPELKIKAESQLKYDSSTNTLIRRYQEFKKLSYRR
jgi:hypothetical protein